MTFKEIPTSMKDHKFDVYSVLFIQDDTKIVSGARDKSIKVWDAKSYTLLKTLEGHKNTIKEISIN